MSGLLRVGEGATTGTHCWTAGGTTDAAAFVVALFAAAPAPGRPPAVRAGRATTPLRPWSSSRPRWGPLPVPATVRRRAAAPMAVASQEPHESVAPAAVPPAPAWGTVASAAKGVGGPAAVTAAAAAAAAAAEAAAAAATHGNGDAAAVANGDDAATGGGGGGAGAATATPAPTSGVDFHGIPNPSAGAKLTLSDLRSRLLRQEETIIFALIERSQFRLNPLAYTPGALVPGYPGTFSRYLLHELEVAYAKTRRYTSPDEHPFTADLPASVLPPLDYPPTLVPNSVNVNPEIEAAYVGQMLSRVCEGGDDQNYGSSATCDAACLQALSKRVHYGKFVAEAKFQEDPAAYTALIRAEDRQGIWDALTNSAVEEVLLRRVRRKAMAYGGDVRDVPVVDAEGKYKVDPQAISDIYRDIIIPLTKKVEVEYLMQRV